MTFWLFVQEKRIPVDVIVVEGSSAIDESMITGESLPNDKRTGDEVIGATINKNGLLNIRATKVDRIPFCRRLLSLLKRLRLEKAPFNA